MENQTPQNIVQKLARHSDRRLTFNTYARTFEEAEQKAINFLPNFGDFVLGTSLDNFCIKQEVYRDNQRHKNSQDALQTAILAKKKYPQGESNPCLQDENLIS
jgi:hypothetical protein